MARGWFITFEGGEGSGKTTQVRRLAEHLRERGFEVVVTREPGGTPLAEAVREILLDPGLEPDALTELFLLEAARHDHVERVIRPALDRGAVVLCDRFADSSAVYQGLVGGVEASTVERLNRLATGGLEPDLTFVLDVAVEEGLARVARRNGGGPANRIDARPETFHAGVRGAFLDLARRGGPRFRVLPAGEDPGHLFELLLRELPEELR